MNIILQRAKKKAKKIAKILKNDNKKYMSWYLEAFYGIIVSEKYLDKNKDPLEHVIAIKMAEKVFSETHINRVVKATEEEKTKKRIQIIKNTLGVIVIEEETEKGLEVLKDIIEARVLRLCPKCKSKKRSGKVCDLCKGEYFINGVEEEKYLQLQT